MGSSLKIIRVIVMLIISVAVDGTLTSAVDGQALFIRNQQPNHSRTRTARQDVSKMEGTVHSILEWLQQQYSSTSKKHSNSRTARQQTPSREYLPSLPVSTTQRPRPFQTSAPQRPPSGVPSQSSPSDSSISGYPYPNQPRPSFTLNPERPSTYEPSSAIPPSTLEPQFSGYKPSVPATYLPPVKELDQQPPVQPTNSGSPESFENTGLTQPEDSGQFNQDGGILKDTSDSDITSLGISTSLPTRINVGDENISSPEDENVGLPAGFNASSSSGTFTSPGASLTNNEIDADESHPPHVHSLNVICSKDSMTIDIEFNRQFNGVIYSKGYYSSPECRYVAPNSGQTQYSFTVMLNMCGTQFIDNFSEEKQAYLENVLVLQNEPGFQEVWDSIRSVRCLWEGNVNKMVSVGLNVDTLNHELVTFNGDTATAKMDIQVGRGPFAPAANGLVKIGETMTLVVTVEGDPDFNVIVRDCAARDNNPNSGNIIKLTDEEGCVLKHKLIGAFQTTRNPDTNSVIAYAFFQAFKFPDVMDLTIECNVELCKANCQPCSKTDQKIEPGRRRRDVSNSTLLADPFLVGRKFRVYLPEEIETTSATPVVISLGSMSDTRVDSVCMSSGIFVSTFSVILGIMTISSFTAVSLWFKLQRQHIMKK